MDGLHGFEGMVFEDFLADFVPDIFLGIQLRRVRRQKKKLDIARHDQIAIPMVGCAVEHQQNVVSPKAPCQHVEKNLETSRVGGWHDQIGAGAILWTDRAVEIGELTNPVRGDGGSDSTRRPAWSRAVDPAKPRFVREHDFQAAATHCGRSPCVPDSGGKVFF